MLVKRRGNKYRVRSTKVKRCEHGTEKYYCKDCGGVVVFVFMGNRNNNVRIVVVVDCVRSHCR